MKDEMGSWEVLTSMLSEDSTNCGFCHLLGMTVRGTGQHHLLLLLWPDNASFFPRQAPFLSYRRNLHFISPLHEIAALCGCTKRGFVFYPKAGK